MERRGSGGFKYNGNKKQAGSGQKPSGMEQDCVGGQSPQRAVVFEKYSWYTFLLEAASTTRP